MLSSNMLWFLDRCKCTGVYGFKFKTKSFIKCLKYSYSDVKLLNRRIALSLMRHE